MSSIYFEKLVEFYRGLGRPSVNDCSFEYRGRLTNQFEIFKYLWDNADQSIADFELVFDSISCGTCYEDTFPESMTADKDIILTVSVPIGDFKFIESLEDFLLIDNNLNTGGCVENVYLVKEDFLFGETNSTNEQVLKALQLSKFITELYDLANYNDHVEHSGLLKLVFIDTSNSKKTSPIVIEPRITIESISFSMVDLAIFKSINENGTDNAHVQEKQAMFRVSIIEVLKDIDENTDKFNFLIEQWELLKETYYGNFECYLTNFSFLKQKKEAAENYMTVSSKISGTLSSISGKLFGLPISFAVAIAISKADKFESILALLGVAITSLLIALTIYDQKKVLKSIMDSIDALFSHTKAQRSGELAELISKHKENLYSQARSLDAAMVFLLIISALPVMISLGAYIFKFNPSVILRLNDFIDVFMNQLLS
ncbi:hypothetical protein ABL07_000349 [Salmonella enterica subsp. enterica serovar Chailey]|uniref:Uncharacterized protein n=1 Tax=Salmonella enterica subsp. enterica serovar Cerro TaxID=340188 RepID=A0A5W9FBL9_SALET|nr:hypothetical protein [Salmonella enterica subsp. enterica serovar Cerro]ECI0424557.1 hypothetical protein [Salmonella enterica subsp. enterica]EDR8507157.1 hypothetical protein [Salmonella enterica]ELP2122981.1 hypothetical protein [Salmonella enterica subsp. enterica serovar Chailey]HBC6265665.1 hypothetical protein [Citrobacter braakii]